MTSGTFIGFLTNYFQFDAFGSLLLQVRGPLPAGPAGLQEPGGGAGRGVQAAGCSQADGQWQLEQDGDVQ